MVLPNYRLLSCDVERKERCVGGCSLLRQRGETACAGRGILKQYLGSVLAKMEPSDKPQGLSKKRDVT